MGLLKHITNLSLLENYDNFFLEREVLFLATTLEFEIKPCYDSDEDILLLESCYDSDEDDVPLDEFFYIDIHCEYLRDVSTNNLKKKKKNNSENEDSEQEEEEVEEDEFEIRRMIGHPVQGFPSSYEEAWDVVYKLVEEHLDFVRDSYILPVLTEELTNWALYLVNEIPKGRKKFFIRLDGKIHEIKVSRPPPPNDDSTSSFIIEVAVLDTVENVFRKSKRLKRQQVDEEEELVINVYVDYKPIIMGSETSICKVHKCTHPANELWDLDSYVLGDIVSMMLKQVDLPGELPRACLLNETLDRVRFLIHYDGEGPLELNVAIRITEILHPTASTSSMENGAFARLKVNPNMLFTPLRSCHIRPNT